MLGIVVMALLNIAKQKDIDSGIEPSLGQEDNFVIMENAEEIEQALRKQSQQKATEKDYYNEDGEYVAGYCPRCDYLNPRNEWFCRHCGQALDWSER